MGALQPLAVVQDYAELQAAFRAYVARINASRGTIDAIVGWADGYAGKTLAAAPSRGIGSGVLGDFLKGMGLVLIVAQDVEQFEQIKHRLPARDERQARDGHHHWRHPEFMPKPTKHPSQRSTKRPSRSGKYA